MAELRPDDYLWRVDNQSLGAFPDFPATVDALLEFLHERIGLDMWAVGAREGDEWMALSVTPNAYGVEAGDRFAWADMPCAAMVDGLGPTIAPDVANVPVYAAAEIGSRLRMGAYAGAALVDPEGGIFGSLCAFNPEPLQSLAVKEAGLVKLFARILSTALAWDLKTLREKARTQRMRAESLVDEITGLGNRRYWMHLLAAEENRCARYGVPASVIMLEVHISAEESPQDEDALRRASSALQMTSRVHDVVARVGRSSLAMLAVNCDRSGVRTVARRLERALEEEGLRASVSVGVRGDGGLSDAWQQADRALHGSIPNS